MNRNKFIKITSLAAAGAVIAPQLSFTSPLQDFSRAQLIGKGNPDLVGDSYTSTMHRDAKQALQKMASEAKKEGIAIEVVSAYRSFERQKQIFERKYRQFTQQGLSPTNALEKIIEYSTIPGTSRHHWGTDLDLIDGSVPRPKNVLETEHFHGTGPFCKFKAWMDANANRYGFYEVYTDNGLRKGFAYEPWHFSYAPVSIPMLGAYRDLEVGQIIKEEKVLGAAHFTDSFIERYRNENILDINPELLS